MSNKGKLVLILLSVVVLVGIVTLEIISEKNETIKECQIVFKHRFFCKVERVEKIAKDHGTVKIYCKNIATDTMFIFYPIDVYKSETFYTTVTVGDTLKKTENNNCFWIINSGKKDSIIFNCEY